MSVLLPTKFYFPPVPSGFVARPQLLEKLDEALTRRLTLVSAPPGAGKTTLVSAWVQSVRKKGAAFGWLSLDGADNDPGRFLEYLAACLEEGGIVIDIISGQDQVQDTLAGFIRGLMDLKREVILVLDDYHVIQNQQVHAALQYLLDHGSNLFHLVILTRSDPPLELARLRVAGQLVEVRMDDLRFSVEEAGEFLKASAGLELKDEQVSKLNARSEGWIAGLQMAAISLRGAGDTSAFVDAFAGSHRYVFDYLIEQVLDRQTPEIREFLLKTSILERLSVPLCDIVAGTNGGAGLILKTIEKANLFLVPLDDEHRWYRYHQLFSDLLKMELEQTHPGLSIELHHLACHWFEAQGFFPEALHHALVAGDMELVVQIVSANVLVLIENDEMAPILQKLESVPPDQLACLPWLGLARAWALGAGEVNKAHGILDVVERNVESWPDPVERLRLKGHIAAVRAFLFSIQGDQANTIAQASLANEILPPDEIAVRSMNLTIWGDIRSDDRRHDPETMPILEQALSLALQAKKPHVAMIAAAALASANLHAGRLHEVHRVCLEALKIADDYQSRYQQPLSATANVYSLLGRVLAEWDENEKAIQFARKGLLLSERWGQADAEVICLLYLGRALVFANEWVQARSVLERAQTAAKKISPWYWEMSITFSLDSLLDSEMADAGEINQQVLRVQESGARYTDLLKSRLLLRENQPDEALVRLDKVLSLLNGRPSFDNVRIYGLRALAYQARGDEKTALVSLKQALDLAEPENCIMTFVRAGPAMEKLLLLPKARSIAPEFVSRLLAAFESRRKHKPVPTHDIGSLIEPLSERECEVLNHLNSYLSTPEIADLLVVSTNTVRTHIKSIYGKLGVHGRSGAMKRASELGLLT